MALNEFRYELSTLLRMTFLLAIFIVILECQAVSGSVETDGNKALEPPEEGKLADLDLQGMGKSRSKRSSVLDPGVIVPGIDPLRTADVKGPFPNGKLCWSGGDPFNEAEAEAYRKAFVQEGSEPDKSTLKLDPTSLGQLAANFSEKCENKKCSFDPKTVNFLCGNPTENVFPDGKICLDGSDPPAGVKYHKEIPSIDKLNRAATQEYGKWCKSGKCVMYYKKVRNVYKNGQWVCGNSASISVERILLLLVSLFGLCILSNLQ